MPTLKRTRSSQRTRSPQQQQVRAGGRPSSAGGGAGVQAGNLILLVLVAVAVIIAAGLLAKTVNTARSIDGEAQSINKTGTGINASTDSIVGLVKTNQIASSILRSAKPLQPGLAKIVQRAKSINGSAASIDGLAATILGSAGTINNSATTINGTAGAINSVAGTINGTAGAINNVAGGINSVAGQINGTARAIRSTTGPGPGILGVAVLIDRDAANINTAADKTIVIAKAIKVDTGNILENAKSALDTAACIDRALNVADKGDCAGKP